jgi:hypothetical protein
MEILQTVKEVFYPGHNLPQAPVTVTPGPALCPHRLVVQRLEYCHQLYQDTPVFRSKAVFGSKALTGLNGGSTVKEVVTELLPLLERPLDHQVGRIPPSLVIKCQY